MSDEQKFGHKSDERVRWRHIVMVLDEYAPTWRELAYDKQNDDPIAWLGDAAVQAVIAALKRPTAPTAPEHGVDHAIRVLKTQPKPVSAPMLGGYRLLQMIALLANKRAGYTGCTKNMLFGGGKMPRAFSPRPGPATRDFVSSESGRALGPASWHYWEIFDRITRGEKP